jgi:NTP pyrophosphatase (non-canonical NTP hydrolase)
LSALHASSFAALNEEVIRARAKFPGSEFLYTALCEEVGELARAILQKEGRERICAEALQVACVAMRIFEEGDPIYNSLTAENAKP